MSLNVIVVGTPIYLIGSNYRDSLYIPNTNALPVETIQYRAYALILNYGISVKVECIDNTHTRNVVMLPTIDCERFFDMGEYEWVG